MEWYTILLVGIAILFALFLSGAPIFLAFLAAILTGIYFIIGPAGFPMFVNSVLDTATTTSLASIPLFILMGELLFRSGTMDVLFDSIDKLVGKVRGRQYVLVVSSLPSLERSPAWPWPWPPCWVAQSCQECRRAVITGTSRRV